MINKLFFRKKKVPFLINVEKYGTAGQATDDYIIRRMRFACRIPETTNTHSEYVILVAFPLQQCLQESVSRLCLHMHYVSCKSA
jgi:hypothetical protein